MRCTFLSDDLGCSFYFIRRGLQIMLSGNIWRIAIHFVTVFRSNPSAITSDVSHDDRRLQAGLAGGPVEPARQWLPLGAQVVDFS